MRGREFLPIVVLLLIVVLWIGCAGPSQDRRPDGDVQTTDQRTDEGDIQLGEQMYVDVYANGGDDWRDPWQPDIKPPARFDLTSDEDERTETVAEEDLRMVQGFRLQLADVLEHASATEIQDRALMWFDHVYVTFRSPNYKVRAGNFRTRVEANQKLRIARDNGFRDAWIVPDWVFETPPPSMRIVADSLAVDAVGETPEAADGE